MLRTTQEYRCQNVNTLKWPSKFIYSTTAGWMECHRPKCFGFELYLSMAEANRCSWKPVTGLCCNSGNYWWQRDNRWHCSCKRHIPNDRRTWSWHWVSSLRRCGGRTRTTTQEFRNIDFYRWRWWVLKVKLYKITELQRALSLIGR